jgi:hypothetical protein
MCPRNNITIAQLPKKQRSKKVKFHQITIMEFRITLGDNPAVSTGPPFSMEREAQRVMKGSLDAFEHYRPKRRSARKLRLSRRSREYLLLKNGFDENAIDLCTMEAEQARRLRRLTLLELSSRNKQTKY